MGDNWGNRPSPTPKEGTCGKPTTKGRFIPRPVIEDTDVVQGSYEEGYCTKPVGHWGKC